MRRSYALFDARVDWSKLNKEQLEISYEKLSNPNVIHVLRVDRTKILLERLSKRLFGRKLVENIVS